MQHAEQTDRRIDWVPALRRRDPAAMAELRRQVRARLGAILGRGRGVSDHDLDDFTQDACLRVLQSLDTFRGEAAFLTWAMTLAVRIAMTALRRRRWTAGRVAHRLDALVRARIDPPDAADLSQRRELFDLLRRAINRGLTPRQRQVILAELEGIPQVLIAERLGSSPGAVYKVSHDARLKLRRAFERAGFDADTVRDILARPSMEHG